MSTQLIIDVGKSAVRAGLSCGGRAPIVVSREPGLPPATAGDGTAAARLSVIVDELLDLLGGRASTCGVRHMLFASTALLDAQARNQLADAVRAWMPAAAIAFCDDGIAMHAAALDGPGTVLTVGTGIAAVHRTVSGEVHRADGWGPLVGDRGSAFDIGRAGLTAVFRAVDLALSTALREQATARFGEPDIGLAVKLLAQDDAVARISAFAEDVVALSSSDHEAERIVRDAVDRLVDTVDALRSPGAEDVAVLGRLGDSYLGRVLRAALVEVGYRERPAGRSVFEIDVAAFCAGAYRDHIDHTE
ncbi:BadF/BadG/BcrA/BcrD ATPase family protein [Microbacterium sp. A94]|uniref:BadF/BadG/BcrA/BcrD ATPase family protein n=1 Tax=Microbacterium sp. A94 TaxID=3450717 RepID=UPI003F423CF2